MNLKTVFAPIALAAMALSTPALADTIPLTSASVGQTYTLNYNGFSDGSTISGLSALTTFTLTSINGSTYNFDFTLQNTTSSPLTSRVSSFGFNTNPDLTGATSTGAYAFPTLDSSYPNGIGSIDVCFKDASTGSCSGGGSGGIDQGATGTGTFSLTFAGPITELDLSDFYVRYQSITGAGNVTSASGAGTLTSSGGQVPEPGVVGLIGAGMLATVLLRRRRRTPERDMALA